MLIGMVAGPGIFSFALFKTYCCVLSVLPRLLWLPTVCCLHAALDELDALFILSSSFIHCQSSAYDCYTKLLHQAVAASPMILVSNTGGNAADSAAQSFLHWPRAL
jgi:hypothetical protein